MASKGNVPPNEPDSSPEIVRTPLFPITAPLESYYIAGHNLRPRKRPPTENPSTNSKKKRHPQDIFQKGSFKKSIIFAQKARKWLLVNIEAAILTSESQLERILRENDELKSLITENFVVWKEYQSTREGMAYRTVYQPVRYPYLAVLDPANGISLQVLHSLDVAVVYEFISKFVSEHQRSTEESPGASTPPPEIQQSGYEQDTKMDTSDNASITKKLSQLSILGDGKENAWMTFLGGDRDPKMDFVMRLPNGERREISWPGTSKLRSLYLYAEDMGFKMEEYEIIAVHPHRRLTDQDLGKTLQEFMFPREVIFLQLKWNFSN